MEGNNSSTNKSSIIKEFLNDLSSLLDSRICEINKKLLKSKTELMENFEKMINDDESTSSSRKKKL